MNIKKIPKDTQTLISASAYINNYTRVIEELVYNSLDAECTSIAIRVSIQESFIQILDNGIGINKENFCLLGQKYATSKHIDVTTLKSAPDKYGFRGLSLASTIEVSQDVLISSKYCESGETWIKTFHNGTEKEFCIAPVRPSKGTTVEIRGFLYNLNIQRKSIDNLLELQNIKSSLEQLSLIHCNMSISLRDDYKNEIIFNIHKKRDIYQTLWSLFEINREDVQELQVEKNQYTVKAFISKGDLVKQNQWIYLNGKFVSKTEIHKKVNKILNKFLFKHNKITKIKNKNNDEYSKSDLPFYFMFISCPFYDFDIMYKNKQTVVEFKDWKEIDKLIEKIIQFYCGETRLKETVTENKIKVENTRFQVKQIIERILNNNVLPSSVQCGIKGKNIKRKKKKKNGQIDQNITFKSQKPINNFEFLNFKEKQELQYNKLNNKRLCDTKKESRKPGYLPTSLKDLKRIKNKNKTSSKLMKKIKNVDCLINKFKNQTDSVKKRCAKLSSEAHNIVNIEAPQNRILKLTYRTEYSETISYRNKELARDTCVVTTQTKYHDDHYRTNKEHVALPKTSYDLIKPFNQVYEECRALPDLTASRCTRPSPHVVDSESWKSLHQKNTFDSHNYQNNSVRRKHFKHFISTSSRQNNYLQNNIFHISRNNLHGTKKSLLNEMSVTNNVTLTRVCCDVTDSSHDATDDNKSRPDVQHCDSHISQIDKITVSGLLDDQSLIKSDFGKTYAIDKYSVKNAHNKTYSVHFNNNLSEYSSIKLPSVQERSNTRPTPGTSSPTTRHCGASSHMDPRDYCQTIVKSNELGDITKEFIYNITSNREKEYTFDDKLLDDGNNENSEANLLRNTVDKETLLKDTENLELNNFDMEKLNILTQNNLPADVHTFQLKKRHDFIPKGMSQVYRTRLNKKYDLSNTTIDYYENAVYNNFADDVLVNAEIFSPMLQNVDVKSRKSEKTNDREDCNLIFDASSLKEAKVLGQVDGKFISGLVRSWRWCGGWWLVVFDQHAVHERILLENNLTDYFDGSAWRGVALEAVPLKLDKHDLLYLFNHRLKFLQFGLQWAFLDDGILINSIPKAILGKNPRQEDVVLKAVRRLILEEIDVIKSLGGNVTLYPKAIMDLVFSEACRYAIKFGDKLTNRDCVSLIEMLSTCKTPFQCAHGRPVMAVLVDLPRNIRSYEINVDTIKQFKVQKCI